MRPIEAWNAFFQASSLYTVYLKGQAAVRITNELDSVDMDMLPDEHDCHDELRECLEQRLYWSCIKSERLAPMQDIAREYDADYEIK